MEHDTEQALVIGRLRAEAQTLRDDNARLSHALDEANRKLRTAYVKLARYTQYEEAIAHASEALNQ